MEQNYYQGIADIRYNILTLPEKIQFMDGHQTQYSYDAAGIKHKVVHTTVEGNVTVPLGTTDYTPDTAQVESTLTTEYFGNIVYENDSLKYILTPEGYITKNGNDVVYNYYLRDHLGNNRVVLEMGASSPVIIQKTDYYPFGMPYISNQFPERQPYQFGGKEYDHMHGLNWYDFHARQYNGIISVFGQIDPLAEKYYSVSPYAYCLNNPVKYVDTDGKEPRIYVETKGFGHAFVTTGSGANTTVYTYGRYGELGKNKSSARSTSPTGEGVLIRLTGNDAKVFIQDQIIKNEAVTFEFTKGSDEAVAKHFDNIFNSSDKVPVTEYKHANEETARVVDKYNLLNNNCVTTSADGVQSGVKQDLKLGNLKGPAALKDVLNVQSGKTESNIIKLPQEEIKKELNLP